MTSLSRQFPQTRAGGKCNQVAFPTHSPATTTRSDRGFELSPRLRSSKMLIRKPSRRLHPRHRKRNCRSYTSVSDGSDTAGCETFYFDCAMEMERQLRSTGAFGIRDGGSQLHFVHMFNLRMRSYERQFERHAAIMEQALGARSCGRRCSGLVVFWATEGRRTNKDKPWSSVRRCRQVLA